MEEIQRVDEEIEEVGRATAEARRDRAGRGGRPEGCPPHHERMPRARPAVQPGKDWLRPPRPPWKAPRQRSKVRRTLKALRDAGRQGPPDRRPDGAGISSGRAEPRPGETPAGRRHATPPVSAIHQPGDEKPAFQIDGRRRMSTARTHSASVSVRRPPRPPSNRKKTIIVRLNSREKCEKSALFFEHKYKRVSVWWCIVKIKKIFK